MKLYVVSMGEDFEPPPPDRPIVASGVPPSGRAELTAELYPFNPSERRQPFFRELAMLLSALLGVAASWLLADVSHEIRSPLQRMEIALVLARGAEGGELEECLGRL